MRRIAALAAVIGLLAGCGGGSDATTSTPAKAPTGALDEAAARDIVVRWSLEGPCELMTDAFLKAQTLGSDERQKNCDTFRKTFTKPQYTADDIKTKNFETSGAQASIVVYDDNSNIEATYHLLRVGGAWQIDSAD
jgi:hypothetical protein